MQKSEILIITILGTIQYDIRPFAVAMELLAKLLFEYNIPKSDIYFTKHICPLTALCLGKSCTAIEKSIYRTSALLWDTINPHNVVNLFGRKMTVMPAPYDILFYMTYLLHHDEPFYHAVKNPILSSFHKET